MKIILQKDVPHLGEAGDIKIVADGYARNYLLPNKFAERASEGKTKMALHQKKLAEIKKDKRKKSFKEISKTLEGKVYEFFVKTGENDKLYGSVTTIDIANLLKKDGIEIDKRKIELPEHIKALGEYKVKIKLEEGIQAHVKLKIQKEPVE
ncbi:MAG: 50S ribosomal protein L9 [Leptospiraceae bacterium]|nr:50S ribosomal protein L9 [Leptospiraceae bacterium]MCP5497989.1 50S ribosomal protein L9 [Leptospiraceae bacterium]